MIQPGATTLGRLIGAALARGKSGGLELPTGWAIVGRRGRVFRRAERIVRFAGGRSRTKLRMTAAAMNDGGEFVVTVEWYGPNRRKTAKLDRARTQRAARKARRRGEAR